MKKTLWIVTKIIRHRFKYIFGLVFTFLVSSFIAVLVNLLNKSVINTLIRDTELNELSALLIGLVIAYITVSFLSNFLGFLQAFANNLFRLKVDVFMQEVLMKKSINSSQERFYEASFLDKYTFVFGNVYNGSSFIFKLVTLLFSNLAIIFSSAAIFIKYQPWLLIYIFLIFAIVTLQTIVSSKIRYSFSKKHNNKRRYSGYYSELFLKKPSAREMRIYNFSDVIYKKWNKINTDYANENVKVNRRLISFDKVLEIIRMLIRFGVMSLLIINIRNGDLDVGTFVMLIGLIETCAGSISSFTENIFSGAFYESKYFNDYYDLVYPISSKEIKEALNNKIPHELKLFADSFKELRVDGLSFIYPNSEKEVLKNVSFTIKKGEIISILGYNGSGKTTLSKLLYGGFGPKKGYVSINGELISDYNVETVSKYFGIAPQEFSKFSLPVRKIVGLGCIEKMDDDTLISEAYERAHLQNLINKLSNGDLTIIGKEYDSDGVDLSGGEMQSIILSSAYMGNPELLILDEPTASIDPIKEMTMLEGFRRTLAGKTAILISHRIGFARLADRIILMKEGQIVEEGTHEELLNQNGYYAEMYNKQKALYE